MSLDSCLRSCLLCCDTWTCPYWQLYTGTVHIHNLSTHSAVALCLPSSEQRSPCEIQTGRCIDKNLSCARCFYSSSLAIGYTLTRSIHPSTCRTLGCIQDVPWFQPRRAVSQDGLCCLLHCCLSVSRYGRWRRRGGSRLPLK